MKQRAPADRGNNLVAKISDGHGTGRDEIWLFIRPARLAKDFIPRARAKIPGPREARDSVGHMMVNTSSSIYGSTPTKKLHGLRGLRGLRGLPLLNPHARINPFCIIELFYLPCLDIRLSDPIFDKEKCPGGIWHQAVPFFGNYIP
jgi:hypothetical protein